MAKFKIKSKKTDNSHPLIKIALRKWILNNINPPFSILDVYGANGLMFKRVWHLYDYSPAIGESINYLETQKIFTHNIFDIDPYASPYEALKIICSKSAKNKIGVVCTDGTLRRASLMRTKIPKFLQKQCGWPERDLSLMAGIYNQYPSFYGTLSIVFAVTTQLKNLP